MLTRIVTAIASLFLVLVAGCNDPYSSKDSPPGSADGGAAPESSGDAQPASSSAAKGANSFEKTQERVLENLAEWTRLFATVKDRATEEAARPRAEQLKTELVGRIDQLHEFHQQKVRPTDAGKAAQFANQLEQQFEQLHQAMLGACGVPTFGFLTGHFIQMHNAAKRDTLPFRSPAPWPSEAQRWREPLFHFQGAYRTFKHLSGSDQADWDALRAFAEQKGAGHWAAAVEALQTADMVVYWDVADQDSQVGPQARILAHTKELPVSGGPLVTLEGEVFYVEPAEYYCVLLQRHLMDVVPNEQQVQAARAAQPAADASSSAASTHSGSLEPSSNDTPAPSNRAPAATPAPSRSDPASPPVASQEGNNPTTPFFRGGQPQLPGRSQNNTPPDATRPAPNTRKPAARVPGVELAGGAGGSPFHIVDEDGRPVIGLRYREGTWAGKAALARVEPLFEPEPARGSWKVVMAKDGYAIGAIQVDSTDFVHAIRLAFMRIDDARLDPQDSYTTDWLGKPSGKPPQMLNGNGKRVIGIAGRQAAVLDATGLVFAEGSE